MATAFCVADIEAMMLSELLVKKRAQVESLRLNTFLKRKALEKEQVLLKKNATLLEDLWARKTERTGFHCALLQCKDAAEICVQLRTEKELTKGAVKKYNELHVKEKDLAEQKTILKRQKDIACKKVWELTNKMRQLATDELEELEEIKETSRATGSWPTSSPNW